VEATVDRSTAPWTLRLVGDLEIGNAAELHARLLEALASGEPIQVEMEAVTGVDLTGLQLLAVVERAAQARGVAWVRSGVLPESLRRTAEESGWAQVPFAGDTKGQGEDSDGKEQ
jgi:anti-anti-sigma regulatory factor